MSNRATTRRGLVVWMGALLASGLMACGGDENNTTPAVDMGVDMAEVDMTPPDPCPGKTQCGNECVNLQDSANNCGMCGKVCGRGVACVDSECVCFASGKTWCGEGICTDPQVDNFNCGECGKRCATGSYCQEGKCVENGEIGEIVAFTNETRAEARTCGDNGFFEAVGPLGVDETLEQAAQLHAEDMALRDYFAHDNPDGASPTDRMRAAGFTGRRTGENIACGQGTPRAAVDAWIKSDGHCSNMMSGGYTLMGAGYHRGGSCRHYWVQNFGAK